MISEHTQNIWFNYITKNNIDDFPLWSKLFLGDIRNKIGELSVLEEKVLTAIYLYTLHRNVDKQYNSNRINE